MCSRHDKFATWSRQHAVIQTWELLYFFMLFTVTTTARYEQSSVFLIAARKQLKFYANEHICNTTRLWLYFEAVNAFPESLRDYASAVYFLRLDLITVYAINQAFEWIPIKFCSNDLNLWRRSLIVRLMDSLLRASGADQTKLFRSNYSTQVSKAPDKILWMRKSC